MRSRAETGAMDGGYHPTSLTEPESFQVHQLSCPSASLAHLQGGPFISWRGLGSWRRNGWPRLSVLQCGGPGFLCPPLQRQAGPIHPVLTCPAFWWWLVPASPRPAATGCRHHKGCPSPAPWPGHSQFPGAGHQAGTANQHKSDRSALLWASDTRQGQEAQCVSVSVSVSISVTHLPPLAHHPGLTVAKKKKQLNKHTEKSKHVRRKCWLLNCTL